MPNLSNFSFEEHIEGEVPEQGREKKDGSDNEEAEDIQGRRLRRHRVGAEKGSA